MTLMYWEDGWDAGFQKISGNWLGPMSLVAWRMTSSYLRGALANETISPRDGTHSLCK